MNKKHISCVDIFKHIFENVVYRLIFIVTLIFALSAHIFMNTYVFNNFYEKHIQTILNEAKKVAQHISRESDTKESKEISDAVMQEIQDDFNIKKIKIIDASGTVLYSTEKSDIGEKSHHKEFFTVVAKGNVFYQIIDKSDNNNSQVAEIYIPLMKNNVFVGASEIYYDITNEITSLNHLVSTVQKLHLGLIILSVSIIFIMLYLTSKYNLIRLYHLEKNKHLEISLQQHSRLSALGEMLENIAHQWRQPLSCITTLMSGIKIKQEMNILTPEDILDANDGILKHAYFLSDTIEHFKNFTKTQGEIKEFNVSKTIKNTLKIVDSTFKTMMINVELNLDENIVYNGIDKELSQALLNILINAKDALLLNNINTRLIKITLEDKEMFYEIAVCDNALGIKESIKNKIFDPYFTTKHQYSGTGLGLYISSQIIKIQFNGEIQTYNVQDNENKGACFIIKLPKKELNSF